MVKSLPAVQETQVQSLGWEDALEKAMAPHSSTLAWKIPRTEEPGGLQSVGSRRVRHDWATSLSLFTFMHWRRKWQPTPVFLPGESQGWRSLVGCHLWGRTESDTTEWLHFHFSLSCIGEGNGNPLQCSCLENPRDGGAWWAAICGVTQSWTRLKWLSSLAVFQLENACVSHFYPTIVLLKQDVCKSHFYQWDAVCLRTSGITPSLYFFLWILSWPWMF